MSLIAIMGSGETAPTMNRTHRRIFEQTDLAGAPAAMLDTTFGFQDNAEELVAKTRAYFAGSLGREVDVATWRRADAEILERERTLALLGRARWVFAGPGSPSYALRQWHGTPVPDALTGVIERGGTLVVGSAAACTVGTHALPVYEIYKAGHDLYWEDGLDLLGRVTGLRAAVIPHFDNHEGGSYDTRYCYLGLPRLLAMEAKLPTGVGVLGVDEHTAVVLDPKAREARVAGNGVLTVRGAGASHEFEAGAVVGFDELAALLSGTGDAPPSAGAGGGQPVGPVSSAATSDQTGSAPASLRAAADRLGDAFTVALTEADIDRAVTAVLDLDRAIVEWSADTLQSDDTDHAHARLRTMIVELGTRAGAALAGPGVLVEPLVLAMLDIRRRAREGKDFATSDLVRDHLVTAGIEVRDTPDGVVWQVREG